VIPLAFDSVNSNDVDHVCFAATTGTESLQIELRPAIRPGILAGNVIRRACDRSLGSGPRHRPGTRQRRSIIR
jgi:hypothetical protein